MNTNRTLLCSSLAILLLIGCGGGGGGSTSGSTTATGTNGTTSGATGSSGTTDGGSPNVQFDGSWSGSYAEPSLNPLHGGTMRIAIASAVVTGTFQDSAVGSGTISGDINQNSFTVVTFTPASGAAVTTYGLLKLDAQNRLVGITALPNDQDIRPPEIDFTLDKAP